MIKTVYFDEQSARDYIDVINGGRFDWSTAEDKERIAKIIAEIDAEIGHGFNLFSWIKASAAGKISGEYDREAKRAIETKLTNTLLWCFQRANGAVCTPLGGKASEDFGHFF